MQTILKKDIFNYKKNNGVFETVGKVTEFVGTDGVIINNKVPDENSEEIYTAPGQTTDDFVKQTRQPGKQNGHFNGLTSNNSYGMVREVEVSPNEFSGSINNNLNNLINSINDNELDYKQKMNVLKYLYKSLNLNAQQ